MWNPFKKPAQRRYSTNPHRNNTRSFFSGDVDRVLSGWTTQSSSIDFYLGTQMPQLRARSREMIRRNPYGKRFLISIKSNVVGPLGVRIQAQTRMGKKLDTRANDAIESSFVDWSQKEHCDYLGIHSFLDYQNLAIANAGADGQFIFRVWLNAGKYGMQIQAVDPELLDISKNQPTRNGGQIRLGVEYDQAGRIVRYHFRERDFLGSYFKGNGYSLPASAVIHGFIREWPDQSQGIPWMHASLERSKMLDKYQEAATVAARAGAMKTGIVRGETQYEGDEDGEGKYDGFQLEELNTGAITDIGDREFEPYDPTYPHQMYDSFLKTNLRGIASGLGISYHTLSGDLEGVNYSSIRAGVLEDREIFKGVQNWFIDQFISPVYRLWIESAWMKGAIKLSGGQPLANPLETYYPVSYQPRRWAWVDPQKDGAANELAINNRTKSRSQVIRDQGDDPESLWREIQREEEMLAELNIRPVKNEPSSESEGDEEEDDEQTGKKDTG